VADYFGITVDQAKLMYENGSEYDISEIFKNKNEGIDQTMVDGLLHGKTYVDENGT
jgi:hypothetical protein